MISTNDTTIIAMLSRYPGMSAEEADTYISRIEHEENVPVCLALLGRVELEELSVDARRTFMEFKRWSDDKTKRISQEEIAARSSYKETRRAAKMLQMHEKGLINDQMLILFGISGELPLHQVYAAMTEDEKIGLWESRMQQRFGDSWRSRVRSVPSFMCRTTEVRGCNWIREGF